VLALADDEQHQGLEASQVLEALPQLERQRDPDVTVEGCGVRSELAVGVEPSDLPIDRGLQHILRPATKRR
jgi:hypothetical protein